MYYMYPKIRSARLFIPLLFLLALVACTPIDAPGAMAPADTETMADSPADTANDGPVTIGAVFSFTGWLAPFDLPPREGAQLAVEAINEAGGVLGRPLELIELDGATDPDTVASATKQLIEQGAEIILAPCEISIGTPASLAAQEAGLVGMSTCASSPLFGSALGDKQFTTVMWRNVMSAAAAEYAYNELGWRTTYVVSDTSLEYSQSLGDYFAEHFAAIGGEVLGGDTYVQGDADFAAQIQRMQELERAPDGLYLSSYASGLVMMVRETRLAGIDAPIIGGDVYDDPEFWAAVGPELANDIYFTTHGWFSAEANEAMPAFIDRYQAKFDAEPNTAYILTGWDAIHVFAQAIELAGTTDGAAVAAVMESTTFDLLSGQLSWSSAEEGHQPMKQVAIAKLQGGEASFAAWVSPENPPAP